MSSTRILVTGGAGFVGSNLAIQLREQSSGSTVVAMDNLYRRGSELTLPRLNAHGVRFHYGDVRDPASFPNGPFDLVVECSAEPSAMAGVAGSPDYLVHTNLVGAYHCLEQARKWNAGVLFLSSSRVYPVAPLEAHPWIEQETRFSWQEAGAAGISPRGVTEALPMNGARSLYGWTKFAAEQLIEEYRATFGLKVIVDRCGVLAGPWQFGKVDQGFVALWIQAHIFGRPLDYIGYGGTGKQVRDVLHVDDLGDLVKGQLGDFERWDGWVGNVSGGLENSVSLVELTRLCREITGGQVQLRPIAERRPGDLRIYIADCARLHARTKWRARRSVRKIVEDHAAWALQTRDRLQFG